MTDVDAIVVGAGPNGLAAAVTLARAGLSVEVLERADTPGGGARTAELTLPGFRHDVCSAVHPMAFASPFFRAFGLEERVAFAVPEISYAHPIVQGRSALAWRDLDRTADGLGRDGPAWRRLLRPLVARLDAVSDVFGDALVRVPRHPVVLARLGLAALDQGSPLWDRRWAGEAAPALLSGVQAHSITALPSLGASASGVVLAALGHGRGWPIPIGGSSAIVDALVADAEAHGARIRTGAEVRDVRELPRARAVLFDTSARAFARLAGSRLPARYARRLRAFRYGDAAAKVDIALSGPVPWTDPELARAGTVHIGGTRAEVAEAEREVAAGRHPSRPYVLVSQPSLVDGTRAPGGSHALWAYTHVPRGSTRDVTQTVLDRIEGFAPGFRDLVLASSARTAADIEAYDPNAIGGDIGAGAATFRQLVARPVLSPDPWRAPGRGLYLCSASAAPGPGVHGLAGWRAALSALRHEFGVREAPSLAP